MADLQLKEEAVPLPQASSFYIFGPQNKWEWKINDRCYYNNNDNDIIIFLNNLNPIINLKISIINSKQTNLA